MSVDKILIRGFTWKARFFNGAVFEYWTAFNITKAEAKQELLDIAVCYTDDEIESIWWTKG